MLLIFTAPKVYSWVIRAINPANRSISFTIYLYFHVVSFTFEFVTFLWLLCLVRKLHHYEYNKIKKSMFLQILIAFFYHCLMIINLSQQVYFKKEVDERIPNPVSQNELRYALVRVSNLLKFIAIIRVKTSVDPLQGINKLDYLLKASVF